MLPPVGWPGWSNPSGTMTGTRTMSWSSLAANPSHLSPRISILDTGKREARIDPGWAAGSANTMADGAGAGAGDRLPAGQVRGPGELHAGRRGPEAGAAGPDRPRRPRARPVLRSGRPRTDDHGGVGLPLPGCRPIRPHPGHPPAA